jgi:hypothetical protein
MLMMLIIFLMKLFLGFLQVEHVIREQNIMAANEIIDLFCELIVTRLPIIAKQKFVLWNLLVLSILHVLKTGL